MKVENAMKNKEESDRNQILLSRIPPQIQSQASLDDQLEALTWWANRLGLYDAANFLGQVLVTPKKG